MAPSVTDPVMILFNTLPPAEFYLIDGFDKVETHIRACLQRFVAQCDEMKAASQDFVDPDTTFLYDKISLALSHKSQGSANAIGVLMPIVGELALKYHATLSQIPPHGGNKSGFLRLALWMACGRQDNENPFETESGPEAKCEPKHCTGCLVDEKWAFLGVACCSKKCQVEHWKEHESICKHRKGLVIAVTQLRALSQLFQSRTCDQTYAILEVKGAPHGTVLLRPFVESYFRTSVGFNITPEAFKGEFVFREVARGFLGPQAGDAEDYDNAIIHHNRCGEHCGVEWPLVERLLNPFCQSITELLLDPKNLAIVITEKKDSLGLVNAGISFVYQVLCVKLLSGEKFIIDLSSAQYGWHEAVSLASDFEAARCARVLAIQQPGESGIKINCLRILNPPDCVETVSHKLKKEVISAMNCRAQEFENQCRQCGEPPLTRSTVGGFVSRLLPIIESAINECFHRYKARDIYRLCLNRNGDVLMTNTTEEGKTYRNIWLTEEEYDPIKDNPEELMKLWKAKIACSHHGRSIKA